MLATKVPAAPCRTGVKILLNKGNPSVQSIINIGLCAVTWVDVPQISRRAADKQAFRRSQRNGFLFSRSRSFIPRPAGKYLPSAGNAL